VRIVNIPLWSHLVRHLVSLFILSAAVAACGGKTSVETWQVASPVAPLATNDDTVLFAERLTGRVMRIDLDRPASEPRLLGQVEVDSSGEQRGMIGLAVVKDRVYGAWTRPGDLRLVVGEIENEQRIVWVGPVTQTKAIGGHLSVLEGRLVVGLGELVEDPAMAGRIVTLDPNGPEDQTPVVVSEGWHNPFAFVVVDGVVVVADNAPDGEAERLGTGELPETSQRALSAVVSLGGARFGVCGYLDGEMRGYEITEDGSVERSGTLVTEGCKTGAVVMPDGSFVVLDDTTIRHIVPA
jgi:hypothetical protein